MKIFQNCKNFVLMGAVALVLTGCGPTKEEATAAVGKAMEANLLKDFAHMTFRQETYRDGMYPTLVFDGRSAQILVTTKPVLWDRWLHDGEVKMHGLAITRNERYFAFTYESQLKDYEDVEVEHLLGKPPCLAKRCRQFNDQRQLSRKEAMKWFYHSDAFTPEKFKDIFGEDAPAKVEEA